MKLWNHCTNSENNYMEPKRQLTLLVAEDDESNFLLLSALLKKSYHIIWAHDGVEVIQKFKSCIPDAILMDIRMPRMDGLSATRAIRELDPTIPIIAVSAYAFEQDKQEAYHSGCDAYVMKPIDSRQLRNTLHLLLSTKQHS